MLPPGIAIRTLNIWDGWEFGLAQAIQAVEHGGLDVMVLTETNISMKSYCWNRIGYDVTFLTAHPTRAVGFQGGFGLVTRKRPAGWRIESTHYHMPNVVSCDLITGIIPNPLVGAYLLL